MNLLKGTARLEYMKFEEIKIIRIQSLLLILKIAFIAKRVILKNHPKILHGLCPKAVVGHVMEICKYVF
jgi:hypothetical protein